MPSIESLRCITAAAKLLHLRAASRSVALLRRSVSRIKQLEEQLGAPLFQRTTRSVRLTESGLALLPAAERCLARRRRPRRRARGFPARCAWQAAGQAWGLRGHDVAA